MSDGMLRMGGFVVLVGRTPVQGGWDGWTFRDAWDGPFFKLQVLR